MKLLFGEVIVGLISVVNFEKMGCNSKNNSASIAKRSKRVLCKFHEFWTKSWNNQYDSKLPRMTTDSKQWVVKAFFYSIPCVETPSIILLYPLPRIFLYQSFYPIILEFRALCELNYTFICMYMHMYVNNLHVFG